MEFGPRFKQVLKKNKVTQAQFCEDNNLNKPLVSRYLNGEKPSVDFIETAINYFPNQDLNFLFSRDENFSLVEEAPTEYVENNLKIIDDIENRLKVLKRNVSKMTH